MNPVRRRTGWRGDLTVAELTDGNLMRDELNGRVTRLKRAD